MKLIKLFVSLFLLTAIIRSTEVKDIHVKRHAYYRGLCANFDIVDSKDNVVKSSFQCGDDWNGIIDGIRQQILDEKDREDKDTNAKLNEQRLQSIKNDYIGIRIR